MSARALVSRSSLSSSSSLDTWGITPRDSAIPQRARALPKRTEEQASTSRASRRPAEPDAAADARWESRVGWLREVERHTEPHRERRAGRYEDSARAEKRKAQEGGSSIILAGKWHLARAKGQRERVDNVVDCGKKQIVVVACQACEHVNESEQRCGCRSLCRSCRTSRAAELRARFLRARKELLEHAEAEGLLRRDRFGGKYSEKFLTLTAPHRGTAKERIAWMKDAVPRFFRMMRGYWVAQAKSHVRHDFPWMPAGMVKKEARRRVNESCAYYRVFEWTSGTDGLGHPHVHVWLFCPFVDVHVFDLRAKWKLALENAGFPLLRGELPILDLAGAKAGIEQELIKYMTKDIGEGGKAIDAATYARVYEAFDGMRACQGSRGFLKLAGEEHAFCPGCGAIGEFRVRMRACDVKPDLKLIKGGGDAARAPPKPKGDEPWRTD